MMPHLNNDTLIDYMHGALSPQEDAAVYAHIEHCDACRSEFEAEAAITEGLRAYAAARERDLPSSVKAEIWDRVRSGRPNRWSAAQWFRPAVAFPAMAAVALAAYLGVAYLGPHGAPSIEAAYYLRDHDDMNSTMPFSDRNASSPTDLETGTSSVRQPGVTIEAAAFGTAAIYP